MEFDDIYDQELKEYYQQEKVCPECKKTVLMKDWPVMPSNGRPKRTCCLTVGWNTKRKYEARKKIIGGVDHWLCNSCQKHRPADRFHKSRGRFASLCADCHRERYRGYKSPTRKRKNLESKKKKIQKDNELIACPRCSRQIKRKFWPKQKGGGIAAICCSEKTSASINRSLRKIGKRFCGSCDQVLDETEFWKRSDGKFVSPCNQCRKVFQSKSGSNEKRDKAIKNTDDGSLTKDVVRNLFIDQEKCLICSKPMKFEDKTLDHVRPLSKGGTHSLKNVIVICYSCNSSKSAKDPSDWFADLSDEQKKRVMTQSHLDIGVFK